ncbi:MAG: hypothetical protein WCT54_01910 [Patescibacteria group bacterium]|jgi:tRNA A37 threonylcarbamoyladenosine modification protein TsaB
MSRFLFIDTRTRDKAEFGWIDDKRGKKTWKVAPGSSGLISSVSARMAPKELAASDGICVVSGPGSFSSIRTGTLVANLLSRTFGLPLYEFSTEEADAGKIEVKNIKTRKAKEYVAPIYDRPPNVTAPAPLSSLRMRGSRKS